MYTLFYIPYFTLHVLFYSAYPILQYIPYITGYSSAYFFKKQTSLLRLGTFLPPSAHIGGENAAGYIRELSQCCIINLYTALYCCCLFSLSQRLKGQCVLLSLSGRHVIKVTLMFNNVLHALLILHQSDLNELRYETKA